VKGPRASRVSAATCVFFVSCASVLVAGCTSARNALGTNSSPCYLALPVAADAVHDRGKFAGVRLVTAAELAKKARVFDALAPRAGGKLHDVCAVEYEGSFTLSQVERPLGKAPASGTGRYAIVVVTRGTNVLLATVVRNQQPEPFRHTA